MNFQRTLLFQKQNSLTAAKSQADIAGASCVLIYRIASNYGLGVYFFPGIFNQVTKQDRRILSEETRTVYNL